MGRCATCGRRIGSFGRKWRKVDRVKHCIECAPNVMGRRRESTMAAIIADSGPRVILVGPVSSRDLDYPTNHRRYTGALLLTDRGVIFAQHGEYKKAESGGALFGLLGATIDALVERGRRNEASTGLTDADVGNAMALVDQAEQLFFFKLDDIKKLKGNNRRFQLKSLKGWMTFQWMNGPQSIKPRRPLLDTYVQAVNTGRDVMADCKGFM